MPADLLTFKIKLCSSQNNHKTESRKCSAWKVVRPVTAEILLPKSLCGGGGWWWVMVGVYTYFSVQLKPKTS